VNVKQVFLTRIVKHNVLRHLRKTKGDVWQRMMFNITWKAEASPQRAAMMEIENERLSLEYDRLERDIKAIEERWT
jgi:hypothetical protein